MSIVRGAAVAVVVGWVTLFAVTTVSAAHLEGDPTFESGESSPTPADLSADLPTEESVPVAETEPAEVATPTCSATPDGPSDTEADPVAESDCAPVPAAAAQRTATAAAELSASPATEVETAVAVPVPPAAAPVDASVAAPTQTFSNCADAEAAGQTNIPAGSPGYSSELDSDKDGFACEDSSGSTASSAAAAGSTQAQSTSALPVTGTWSTALALSGLILLTLGVAFFAGAGRLAAPVNGRARGGFTVTTTSARGQRISYRVTTQGRVGL